MDSVDGELAIPMVATSDIAEVAAGALLSRDWQGIVVRELLGPRDLSHSEATRIIGESIGKPDLQYVPLMAYRERFRGKLAAVILTGGNLTAEQIRKWLMP